MQYVDQIGVTATKSELAALAQFCGESDRTANVSIRCADGKLVAWATNGHNAAYLHGKTWDGKGKASDVSRDWQIESSFIKTIAKSMGKGTEVIFKTNRKLALTEAEIKEIEDGKSLVKFDLDGHVSEQLDLDIPNLLPTRPMRDTGEIPTSELYLAWNAVEMLKKVCKAVNSGAIRVFVSSNPTTPIYCEVATPQQLQDDDMPEWIVIMAPSSSVERTVMDDEEETSIDDDADPAGGDDEGDD